MLNGLDLCTGIAGITEALGEWVRPIAYCENDPHAISQIVSRIERGEIPNAPIWDDVTTFPSHEFRGLVDIVYAGFPCQNISLAGVRAGLGGNKSQLFYHIVRIIKEVRPSFVFLENVWPGVRKFIPTIRAPFEQIGYEVRDGVLSAGECGFPHRRQRWFLLAANVNRKGLLVQPRRRGWAQGADSLQSSRDVATGIDSDIDRDSLAVSGPQVGYATPLAFSYEFVEGDDWDEHASKFRRICDGIPFRGHRIKSLGNTNPPFVYREAFMRLMGIHHKSPSREGLGGE